MFLGFQMILPPSYFLCIEGCSFPKASQDYNHICSANVSTGMFPSPNECCAYWDTLESKSRSSASASFESMNTGIWLHLDPIGPAENLNIWKCSLPSDAYGACISMKVNSLSSESTYKPQTPQCPNKLEKELKGLKCKNEKRASSCRM